MKMFNSRYKVIGCKTGLYSVTVKNHSKFLNHKEGLHKTPIIGFCVEVSEAGNSYSTPVLIDGSIVEDVWIVFDEKTQHWYVNTGARGCTEESLYRYLTASLKNHIQCKS